MATNVSFSDPFTISGSEHLANLIVQYFHDIKDLDPGELSITATPVDGRRHPASRNFDHCYNLTITWDVNGCTGDNIFPVFRVLRDFIYDKGFRDGGRDPFWDLICMYLVKGKVSTRFDHLYYLAQDSLVCQRSMSRFYGSLEPGHPFVGGGDYE